VKEEKAPRFAPGGIAGRTHNELHQIQKESATKTSHLANNSF